MVRRAFGSKRVALLWCSLQALAWAESEGSALPSDLPGIGPFRLGSGTSVPVTTAKPQSNGSFRRAASGRTLAGVHTETPLLQRDLPEQAAGRDSTASGKLSTLLTAALAAAVVSDLLCMMPAGGGGNGNRRETTYRVPPSWSPETDRSYSLRSYMTEIAIWVMLTDLQPHQQCAAIITRLGGAAREVARMVSPQEIMAGGMRNGVQLDPVSYLLAALQDRFSALAEETRLLSMTEVLAFATMPGESTNALLSR